MECYVKAVMKMYKKVLSQMKVEGKDANEFAVRVGIHEGSVLCSGNGCGDSGGGKQGACPDVYR